MPGRPLTKTEVTTLKMTPEIRALWEGCAAAEQRTLTNMFEVLVREHAKRLGIELSAAKRAPRRATS